MYLYTNNRFKFSCNTILNKLVHMFYFFTTKKNKCMLTSDAHAHVVDAGRFVARAAGHYEAV